MLIYRKLVIGVNIYAIKEKKFELFDFVEMCRGNAILIPDGGKFLQYLFLTGVFLQYL